MAFLPLVNGKNCQKEPAPAKAHVTTFLEQAARDIIPALNRETDDFSCK